MGYYCSKCKVAISKGVFSYSMDRFDEALCLYHQRKIHSSTGKKGEAEQKLDEVLGVQKIMSRVSPPNKEIPIIKETDFCKWTVDWRDVKHLNFSLSTKHFLLAGMNLDDYTKQLIRMAKDTILITNPYIKSCYLTDALKESAQLSVKINVVTRIPKWKDKATVGCHRQLKEAKINLRYDRQIHSKIMVVDNEVAVVSSMNFYSGSSGGESKEAGIVSLDKEVVKSAADYVSKLHDNATPFSDTRRLF